MRTVNIGRVVLYTALAAVVAWGVYLAGVASGERREQKQLQTTVSTEQSLLYRINKVREERKLPLLQADKTLDVTAQLKAEDMAKLNYWSHDRPDGERWYNTIYGNRPGSNLVGENLGKCFADRGELVAAWVASPSHLANIVNPEFTKFGEYTVWDADQACFISVNHFAR